MASLRVQFGRQLRKMRRNCDMTQEQFSESVGISVDFLSLMERGINAPSFETLERIARVLKVKVCDLFDFRA
jgi:transcriptional regulator with XRE-family HTH domain